MASRFNTDWSTKVNVSGVLESQLVCPIWKQNKKLITFSCVVLESVGSIRDRFLHWSSHVFNVNIGFGIMIKGGHNNIIANMDLQHDTFQPHSRGPLSLFSYLLIENDIAEDRGPWQRGWKTPHKRTTLFAMVQCQSCPQRSLALLTVGDWTWG